MWKYECKKHLLYTLLAMFAGAILFGVFGFGKEAIILAIETMEETTGMASDQLLILVENSLYLATFGAFYIGGFVNGLMLMFALIRRFNLSSFVMLAIFLLGGDIILLVGAFLLIPTILVCLYGMLTLPNRKEREQLKKAQIGSVEELKRSYEIHHKLDEQGTLVGKEAASNLIKIAILNALAIGIFFMVMLYVNNSFVLFISVGILMLLLFVINGMRVKAVAPVLSLLYDRCQPATCASAIFEMAKKLHRKKTLPLTTQFAECMLLLDDPHLCIDSLALIKTHNGPAMLTYHNLMADAYYLLGDQLMVSTHFEQVEKMKEQKQMNQSMVIQTLNIIQNRIDLMNQDFDAVKRSYTKYHQFLRRTSQLVELHYYLGLIDFVEKNFDAAQKHLEFVIKHGGTTYYVEKADKLLVTLEQIQ